MSDHPRLLPAGDRALLVEVASVQAVAELYTLLRAAAAAGDLVADEIVPGARTLLLDGVEPVRVSSVVLALVAGQAGSAAEHGAGTAGVRTVEVPTRYDGPDLDDVARLWDMTRDEVVATHTGTDLVVAFCGFAPGFAYCTGLPADRTVRRLATPRPRVPAGAVGLAGEFTGVYPSSSPGGWRLIGRTDLVLWRPEADPPATLTPGTTVRFTAVDR